MPGCQMHRDLPLHLFPESPHDLSAIGQQIPFQQILRRHLSSIVGHPCDLSYSLPGDHLLPPSYLIATRRPVDAYPLTAYDGHVWRAHRSAKENLGQGDERR